MAEDSTFGGWSRTAVALDKLGEFLLNEHVVVLEVLAVCHGEVKRDLYSGFFYFHDGLLAWITAGHCIQNLKKIRTSSEVTVKAVRWHDHLAIKDAGSIPTDLGRLVLLDVTEVGHDIGVVIPDFLDAENLRRNPRFHPFTAGASGGHDWPHVDGCYVVGIPRDLVRHEVSEDHESHLYSFRSKAICLATQLSTDVSIETAPTSFFDKEHCLYGHIHLEDEGGSIVVSDIDGLSGSPVLALELTAEQRIRYRVVGVQSSWLAQSRVIRVFRIEAVIALISVIAREIAGKSADPNVGEGKPTDYGQY